MKKGVARELQGKMSLEAGSLAARSLTDVEGTVRAGAGVEMARGTGCGGSPIKQDPFGPIRVRSNGDGGQDAMPLRWFLRSVLSGPTARERFLPTRTPVTTPDLAVVEYSRVEYSRRRARASGVDALDAAEETMGGADKSGRFQRPTRRRRSTNWAGLYTGTR